MRKTFYYQNRIILFFAFVLTLSVVISYLKKTADRFSYVELVQGF